MSWSILCQKVRNAPQNMQNKTNPALKRIWQWETEPNEISPNGQTRKNMSNEINNVRLGYNLKHKINIHKPAVI